MPDHVPSAFGSIFSWSSEKPVHPSLIIGSGLGIGIPMIISGLFGMIGMGGHRLDWNTRNSEPF